jgi:hypothetical protein
MYAHLNKWIKKIFKKERPGVKFKEGHMFKTGQSEFFLVVDGVMNIGRKPGILSFGDDLDL